MPHKHCLHLALFRAELLKELRLELKDAKRPVDELGHLGRALRLPGPDLRDDVVQAGNAELADFLGKTQIESRIVDADQRARMFLLDAVKNAVKDWAVEEVASQVKIIPSAFGENSVALGVVGIVAREVFAQA